MPDGNVTSVVPNFWQLPGTQLGVNLHLGAFERQTRKFGAKSYQVNRMVGDMCDTIEQLNDLGKPKIDNIARLATMAGQQPPAPAPTPHNQYTIDDVFNLVSQIDTRVTTLEGK
tara:strand:+ start:2375 stop:2716 length:342 start_codon:yes stop_codon:yes gene_type:complete